MEAERRVTMSISKLPRVMVTFSTADGGEEIVERMHAIPRGDGRYVLDNSPFYVFGISYGDVFLADRMDGEMVFSGVESRGGHSTYRIRLPAGQNHEFFLRHWQQLEKLGCTYEGSSANPARLYSIDVPPGVDVFEVYRLLEEGEQQGTWVFEEAHYFDPQQDPGPKNN